MNELTDFNGLMARIRAGEPAAMTELCRWFEPFIRAAVRRQLNPRLRLQFDSIDFVQDVWSSFLTIPAGRYAFETPEALLGFLNRIAYTRVVEVFRQRFGTQKHDITRVESGSDGGADVEAVAARASSASQIAIAGEQWDRLVGQFPEGHRVIVERLREGYTYDEIAAMTNVSVSTINRIIRRLKDLTASE